MNKKYIYITVGIIAIILLSLYIGNSIGVKKQSDSEVKTKIEVIHVGNEKNAKEVDSLNKLITKLQTKDLGLKKEEIKLKEKAKEIVIEKPINPECLDLYESAVEKIAILDKVITVKDTIESNLRSQIIQKDNVISLKDQIIENKDSEISLIKQLNKRRDKKFSISIHVGTGVGISKNGPDVNVRMVPVYVGVGISRHLFSF